MVLRLGRMLAIAWLAALVALAIPQGAVAHRDHHRHEAANESVVVANHVASSLPHAMAAHHPPHETMGHEDEMEERPASFSGRLVAFLGNLHPFAVHFPIALIPASWLALLIARRRGHEVHAVRLLVMLAGLASAGAALLGWLNAGFSLTDEDPVQTAHRWLGTGLAVLVAGIAIHVWRRDAALDHRAMTWTLGILTLVLLVQGWLGATLTHGIEHMRF